MNKFPGTLDTRKDEPIANETLARLMGESKFTRADRESPNTTIEANGNKFAIEMVPDGKSETLTDVQGLFTRTFGEEEVDPEEILRAAVDGKTPWGTEDSVKYRVHVIKDSKGEVMSTVAGGRLDLLDSDGKPTNKQMFMIAYAVTDEKAREGGLAREAYISAIMQAAKEAQAEGKELAFAAGECTYTSEKFWNSVGWQRVYGKKAGSENLEELKYVQPALDFNEKTGEVAEDAGAAPEHLMIDSFGKNPPGKEDILRTVGAFYRWCNTWPKEAFESTAAQAKHQEHVVGIWEKFKEQISNSDELVYMTNEQRETLKKTGVQILEHVDADNVEKNTGEEDL